MSERERAKRVTQAITLLESVSFGSVLNDVFELNIDGICALAFHKGIETPTVVKHAIRYYERLTPDKKIVSLI